MNKDVSFSISSSEWKGFNLLLTLKSGASGQGQWLLLHTELTAKKTDFIFPTHLIIVTKTKRLKLRMHELTKFFTAC
jgi:hypothetical protein